MNIKTPISRTGANTKQYVKSFSHADAHKDQTNLANSISSKDKSTDMSEVGDRDMEGVDSATSHTLGQVEVGSKRSRL